MEDYFEPNTSKSGDGYPLTTDEIEYKDPNIPTKRHSSYLPSHLFNRHVLQDWDGQLLELWDNAANYYDSFRYDEEAELMARPKPAKNFRFEKVEQNPGILSHQMCFGRGKAQFKNGMTYNGEMAFNFMHGRGTLEGKGWKFSGTFRNSEIEGDGVYQWQDCTYTGEVKRGLRNGEGYLEFSDGTSYTGDWREGLREGYGKMTHPNGQSYEGYWVRDKKQGYGVLKYASGNVYEGNFAQDKQNGNGTMYWNSTNEKYTGDWKDGLPHGFGVHVWMDGKGNKQLRNRYVGQLAYGKRHGYGVFYYANGSKYEGYWYENLKHGTGKMTFEDGTLYEGDFDKDHMKNRTLSGKVEIQQEIVQPQRTGKQPRGKKAAIAEQEAQQKAAAAFTTRRAKKQVEANPFISMIDISDITEMELDEERANKETQKLLLKFNSNLKHIYSTYSQKIEAVEREEAFTMTTRQFWRFLRDCNIISHRVTIAQVNRIFLQGKKNIFKITSNEIPGEEEQSYSKPSRPFTPAIGLTLDISNITSKDDGDMSSVEEEEEQLAELEIEEVHSTDRPILLRQFYELIVRVAYLKYANGGRLTLMNEKIQAGDEEVYIEKPRTNIGIALHNLIYEKILPNACKRSCKTPEEEIMIEQGLDVINRDLSGHVYDNSQDQKSVVMEDIFVKYSNKRRSVLNGKRDITISAQGVINFLIDCRIVPQYIEQIEVVELLEKFHDPDESYTGTKLGQKLIPLLGCEYIEFEFYEFLVQIAIRIEPIGDDTQDELETVKQRVKKFIDEKLMAGLAPEPSTEQKVTEQQAEEEEVNEEEKELTSDIASIHSISQQSENLSNQLPKTKFHPLSRQKRVVLSQKQLVVKEREDLRNSEQQRELNELSAMKLEDFNAIHEAENQED